MDAKIKLPASISFDYDYEYYAFMIALEQLIPNIKGDLLGYDMASEEWRAIFYLKKDKEYKEIVKKYSTSLKTQEDIDEAQNELHFSQGLIARPYPE